MSLKLIPPRPGFSKNYRIRGTYLKIYVDQTSGTSDKKIAWKVLLKIKDEIERGVFSTRAEPTFMSASLAYIEAGGEATYLGVFDEETGKWTGLIAHFWQTPLSRIDQAAIDRAAIKLYPDVTAGTRNRQVYTPVSAVLKHAGVERAIRRPAGAQGKQRTDWLWPERAFAVLDAAKRVDAEFAIFLTLLCYAGPRLSEALRLTCDDTRIAENFCYLGKTKNGDPRGVHLPPIVVAALANHPRGLDRPGERVFRFTKSGRLYLLWRRTVAASGVAIPKGIAFHIWCHTWATWMRRYAGSDTQGLVGTGRWRDAKSAARYEHVVANEEAVRADLLPVPPRTKRPRAPKIRAKSV